MTVNAELLAEGLVWPEGPTVLDDGRVDGLSDRMCSFAEIKRLLGAEELVAQAARLS